MGECEINRASSLTANIRGSDYLSNNLFYDGSSKWGIASARAGNNRRFLLEDFFEKPFNIGHFEGLVQKTVS